MNKVLDTEKAESISFDSFGFCLIRHISIIFIYIYMYINLYDYMYIYICIMWYPCKTYFLKVSWYSYLPFVLYSVGSFLPSLF